MFRRKSLDVFVKQKLDMVVQYQKCEMPDAKVDELLWHCNAHAKVKLQHANAEGTRKELLEARLAMLRKAMDCVQLMTHNGKTVREYSTTASLASLTVGKVAVFLPGELDSASPIAKRRRDQDRRQCPVRVVPPPKEPKPDPGSWKPEWADVGNP
jgi:hypothetical protein